MDILTTILQKAKQDPEVRAKLLKTCEHQDPMSALCECCQDLGYPLTIGDLLAQDEAYASNLHKSVNGGATYPIEGWSDSYEWLITGLKML